MTSLVKPSRRKFLVGLGAIFAAPAIVKYSSLMPIKPISEGIHIHVSYFHGILHEVAIWDRLLTADEIAALSKGKFELVKHKSLSKDIKLRTDHNGSVEFDVKLFKENDIIAITYGGISDERQI